MSGLRKGFCLELTKFLFLLQGSSNFFFFFPFFFELKRHQGLVAGLSSDEADVAMKHVFAGMATQENCERLLEWHSQLFDKYGIGCIVRAVNERSPCPEKGL